MTEKKRKRFSLGKLLLVLAVMVLLFFLITSVFGKKADNNTVDNTPTQTETQTPDNTQTPDDKDDEDGKAGFVDFYTNLSSGYAGNWKLGTNVGNLNTNVVSGVKAKRTQILGNNRDTITIMVYMCGSDLESQNAMGTYDLQEMARANISDNINLLVYTGGCKRWQNRIVSNTYNQIYRVVGNGNLEPLVENAGTGSMVDPNTLVSFIEWATEKYEANRYELIMWDHGSGSIGGYGYDEKYPNRGYMTLVQMDAALTEADISFDFIGFDACLMANTEAALMLAEHADYLIASEESEPGIGWYYTDWLNALSKNTSMPTIEIGKNIADSFVSTCKSQTRGQSATLSVVDLAELSATVPSRLSAFASSTTGLITGSNYRSVASARSGSREFAQSSYADLVDLVDLATNVGTEEGNELARAILSSVKYNNTTSDMYNSYGLSIYFPYRSTKYVNSTLSTYSQIDMNEEYSECIRSFVKYASSGQVSSGGSHSAYQSYNGYSGNSYYSSQNSSDAIFDLLDAFVGGSYSDNSSYSSYYDLLDLLFRDGIDRNLTDYIAENHFDADLTWKDGKIAMTDKQWSLLDEIRLNVFVDDGTGYIDLGKDNWFEAEDGALLQIDDLTWMAASADGNKWQIVPYYYLSHIDEADEMISYGRIPVLLNDIYANLIIRIDDEGIEVIGVTYDYHGETDVVAKNLDGLNPDDRLSFVCDFYDYDGNFVDNHKLGNELVVKDKLYLGDADISSYKTLSTYELKDLYQQSYWTTPMD